MIQLQENKCNQCWSDIKNEAAPVAQLQIDKSDAGVTGKVDTQNLNGGGVARCSKCRAHTPPVFFKKRGEYSGQI